MKKFIIFAYIRIIKITMLIVKDQEFFTFCG